MISVVICEDNELDRDLLREIINFILAGKNLEYNINLYASGQELVSAYKTHQFDILFLDIVMDGINGIETGRLIRETDNKVEIVYCTSSREFAIVSYDIHALGYLLKPYEIPKIEAVIDYYTHIHPEKNHAFIEIKIKHKLFIISYNDIIYIESDNKVVCIYVTKQNVIRIYSKLDAIEKRLSDDRFLRCHKSYLVNMQYISGMVNCDFILPDGQIIPIRKDGRKLIIKKYEEYLKKH